VPSGQYSFRDPPCLKPPWGGWDRAKKHEKRQGQRDQLAMLGVEGDSSPSDDHSSPSWLALGFFRTRLKEAEIFAFRRVFPRDSQTPHL